MLNNPLSIRLFNCQLLFLTSLLHYKTHGIFSLVGNTDNIDRGRSDNIRGGDLLIFVSYVNLKKFMLVCSL